MRREALSPKYSDEQRLWGCGGYCRWTSILTLSSLKEQDGTSVLPRGHLGVRRFRTQHIVDGEERTGGDERSGLGELNGDRRKANSAQLRDLKKACGARTRTFSKQATYCRVQEARVGCCLGRLRGGTEKEKADKKCAR